MPKSKDLVSTMRAGLYELRDIGWSYRKIHEKYPEIPISKIHYTIKQQSQRMQKATKMGRVAPLINPHRDIRNLAWGTYSAKMINAMK